MKYLYRLMLLLILPVLVGAYSGESIGTTPDQHETVSARWQPPRTDPQPPGPGVWSPDDPVSGDESIGSMPRRPDRAGQEQPEWHYGGGTSVKHTGISENGDNRGVIHTAYGNGPPFYYESFPGSLQPRSFSPWPGGDQRWYQMVNGVLYMSLEQGGPWIKLGGPQELPPPPRVEHARGETYGVGGWTLTPTHGDTFGNVHGELTDPDGNTRGVTYGPVPGSWDPQAMGPKRLDNGSERRYVMFRNGWLCEASSREPERWHRIGRWRKNSDPAPPSGPEPDET